MKNLKRIVPISIILLSLLIIIGSCKKDKEDPTPAFTMSYDSVALVGGGKGLQFTAKCTNNDVTMTSATVTDPASGILAYQLNGASYAKNDAIPMQETSTAYTKKLGTWKFNLVGKTSGGTTFAVLTSIAVPN
jgi:hypothetical protein